MDMLKSLSRKKVTITRHFYTLFIDKRRYNLTFVLLEVKELYENLERSHSIQRSDMINFLDR